MCVICYTNDVNISDEVLKKMWDANPDGAGFAWIEKNKAHFEKGFMKFEDLIKYAPKDRTGMMFHFRIGTSGAKTKTYTHPFDIEKVDKISGESSRLVFHNGIMSINWTESAEDVEKHSDTYLLARDVLKPITNGNVYAALLNGSGSRFALFDATLDKKSWFLYGDWKEWQGLTVSNTNFNYTPSQRIPRYSGGNSYEYWNDHSYRLEQDWEGWEQSGEGRWTKSYGNSKDIEMEDESESSVFLCNICHEKLNDEDLKYGFCEECSIEHYLYCSSCSQRMTDVQINRDEFCESCIMRMFDDGEDTDKKMNLL